MLPPSISSSDPSTEFEKLDRWTSNITNSNITFFNLIKFSSIYVLPNNRLTDRITALYSGSFSSLKSLNFGTFL
jgi:hypothetical protein